MVLAAVRDGVVTESNILASVVQHALIRTNKIDLNLLDC